LCSIIIIIIIVDETRKPKSKKQQEARKNHQAKKEEKKSILRMQRQCVMTVHTLKAFRYQYTMCGRDDCQTKHAR
jgi:hypothetical protein